VLLLCLNQRKISYEFLAMKKQARERETSLLRHRIMQQGTPLNVMLFSIIISTDTALKIKYILKIKIERGSTRKLSNKWQMKQDFVDILVLIRR